MSETLSESQMNAIEKVIATAERNRFDCVYLLRHEARALYDLARRAQLPAVDGTAAEMAQLLAEGRSIKA